MTGGSRLTILMSGMLAGDVRYGGAAWAVLQYVLGLADLGHAVYVVEPVAPSKLTPAGARLADSAEAASFRALARAFGLTRSSALLLSGTTATVGLEYDALRRIAGRADLLVNISGMLRDPALLAPIRHRVFLDLDPGFNQAWHASGIDMHFDAHTHFATVGLGVGRAGCRVPTCGRQWITTMPPVVLRAWPVAHRTTLEAFTTVANWRSYGSLQHDGMFLGQKAHALRPLMTLPQKTPARFALALAIHQSEPDLAALHRNGWTLVDPQQAAGTPGRYRRFVRGSRAELGIAKSGYVETRSGWVSDRSACYLASGRPVLAQDTGFSEALPVGVGLVPFSTESEALDGIADIESNYPRHREAARAFAEQHCDSRRVLSSLIDRVGAAA